jgi:putative Holliday junction resolvase
LRLIILGVDYGDIHTGVAVSDPTGFLASPVAVITESGKNKRLAAVAALAKEKQADKIIVGLPLHMNGSRGEKAQTCEAFAKALQTQTGIPVELWDERLTTVIANNALRDLNIRGKKRKAVVDAVAAVEILQSWLDQQ